MENHHVIPLITEEQISQRIEALAQEIAERAPQEIMIVSLLKGSFMFTADLIRALHRAEIRTQVDFLTLSSYGTGMASSGKVNIVNDLTDAVDGKYILIVDDILESGRTLDFARNLLHERGAQKVEITVLLEKPGKREAEIEADYIGFTIPDKFVVGYGLDYANYYRELPYVGVVAIP